MRLVAAFLLATVVLALSPAGGATPQPDTAAVYGGLGSWVDIFATQAWRDPKAVVEVLRSNGVGTLYLETSNYSQSRDILYPTALSRFVEAAHAAGLNVVGWYLPSFARPALDARRALAAIRFRSVRGQTFDSFALDIEASVVRDVALRNARLIALAKSLRKAVPVGYPLGAIVPSPVGMRRHPHYWPHFPFADLATTFDAFVPMAYFSYYAKTPAAAYAYAHNVIVAIRGETGRPEVPIHLIGGIANRARIAEVESFIQGASDCGVAGVSLYAFFQTSGAQWSLLRQAALGASPLPSCSGY
jgi:hypothetical protein